jgi:hypothetical protein
VRDWEEAVQKEETRKERLGFCAIGSGGREGFVGRADML